MVVKESKTAAPTVDFVHLHNHTHYSLLDGLQKVPQMLDWVQKLGQTAVAITDHGTLSGVIEFYKECQKRVKDGDECPTTAEEVFFDQGPEQKTVAAAPAGKSCQPPAGRTLRYSDRCYNGDCTRTFENGCQVRFQAP